MSLVRQGLNYMYPMYWQQRHKTTPIYVKLVFPISTLKSVFALKLEAFETCAPNDSNSLWTLKSYICVTSVPDAQTSPTCSTTSRFRVTGHFETSVINNPQIILNTNRSPLDHICDNSVSESQISVRLAMWSTIFELQAILGKCTERALNEYKVKLSQYIIVSSKESLDY